MEYNGSYLYPPRPTQAVTPDVLGFYRRRGFMAQVKKNGTNNVIIVSPDGNVDFYTRHNDVHKQWEPDAATIKFFQQFAPVGWVVFSAELMHNKTPHIKHVNYIHDILVLKGKQLTGTTFSSRQNALQGLLLKGGEKETYSHYVINDNIWLAKNYNSKLKTLWEACQVFDEDEGLVLKKADAELKPCFKKDGNSSWQVKVRKQTKNYSF